MSRFFRMSEWLLISLVLTALVFLTAPETIKVTIYKLSLITSAGWLAYWLDCGLFPYARPDSFHPENNIMDGVRLEILFAVAMLRRALIVVGAMIAIALGM